MRHGMTVLILVAVVAAFSAGDADTLVTFYPNDVVLLPAGQPPVVGKEDALTWAQSFFDEFTVDEFTSPVDEVVVANDWAFARGPFSWILSPKAGGDPVQDSGNFMVIWHRAPDGSWKRARVIWNTYNPASAAEEWS